MHDKIETSCRLCGRKEKKPLFEKKAYPIVKCAHCGFVYVPVIPVRDSLNKLYSESYFVDPEGFGYGDYLVEKQAIERTSRKRLRRIYALKRNARTLLEIGCGTGFFLNVAKNTYDVAGVELSDYASAYAKSRLGLNVFKGTVQEASFTRSSFDIVTLWDVIEHVPDPLGLLKEVGWILCPSGLLALSTPDVGSLLSRVQGRNWRLYDPPYHLNYFSPETIALLLDSVGFDIVRIEHTSEWHSLQYLYFALCVYYDNVIFRALKTLTIKMGIGNLAIPVTLCDIMTVYAIRKG